MRSIYRVSIMMFLSLFGLVSQAQADEIRLKNGDVLTGQVIKKETNTVIFRTSYAGDININWLEVASIKSDNPLFVVLEDRKKFNGALAPTESGKVVIQAADAKEVAETDLEKVKYINPSPELVRGGMKWTGRFNVGGTWTQGNTETRALRADAESIVRTLQNRYTVGAVFNRAEDRGDNTQFNSRGYAKYDHFVSEKWYLYANSSVAQDRFQDIRLRTTVGGGNGYQMFESPNLNLALEGGLNYINETHYEADDESYPSVRWAVKYDQMLLNGLTQFFHEHEAFVGLTRTDEILVFSKTGFRFPLTSRLNASTQLNLNWDKSPAPGREKADSTLMFNVGYGW
ncbi:hypothetical protein A7981_08385 [Methylovorus sp. MM2]|uniref:DUF481 domain-containing protein n=1 Tax=Methylovorus sp. MM2 TaxID=1848038 RepID=UPI0007DFE67D|nr:DUF481 domain-containing protein [Methylovorus sp. MM2]OAM51498.1 hypothetical protein A7981_08385 [Methylovorus sp. MM2]